MLAFSLSDLMLAFSLSDVIKSVSFLLGGQGDPVLVALWQAADERGGLAHLPSVFLC